MTKLQLALVAICVIEGVGIWLLSKRIRSLKKRVDEGQSAVTSARQELQKIVGLMKDQKQAEGEARNGENALESTPNSGLAARADGLFRS